MIIIPASGSNLRTSQYWHTKKQVKAIDDSFGSLVDCCFCTCETLIPQFAYLENINDKSKNDIFSWILETPRAATVEATLTNVSTGVDYPITNDDYGFLYEIDDLKEDVWSFTVIWSKVADLIGYGEYEFSIKLTSGFGPVIFDKVFNKFQLMPYSCEAAHNTIRIESWNSGYIEGGFDYRDIEVKNPFLFGIGGTVKYNAYIQQIRYYGRLEVSALQTQIDNHWDNNRNLTQVQTQINNEWNLRIDMIDESISNQIIYDNLLSDFLYLSDYNANNKDYKEIKVSLVSVELENYRNKTSMYNIKFVDYKQNLLKRHY